jgi:hypothetical protein
MFRMTLGLAVALYAAFVIWGQPVEGIAEPGGERLASAAAAADTPIVLENASAPTAPTVTRDASAPPVMPDPATVAAAMSAPGTLSAREPRLIGEAKVVSLVRASAEETAYEPTGPVLQVTGSRVNMRAGPGVENAVVGALPRGARAEALGGVENGWQRIRALDGGQTGYMFASYLEPA